MKEAGNRPVTKYWTFEDWREDGEIEPLPRCRTGIEKKDDSGERVLFLMTPEEITKLETNLKEMYWNEVMQEFRFLKSDFQRGWSDTADPMQITREIEKSQFHLYPEKFVDKPEPYSISILYIDFKDDIPHYREAYANILSYGRPTWMTPLARDDDNYSCRADGMKLYLDWLKSFQHYLKSHKPTKQALTDFESVNGVPPNSVNETSRHLEFQEQPDASNAKEVAPVSMETKRGEGLLGLRQAALVLRYRGITVTSTSHHGSEAAKLAKEMCGRTSKNSGSEFFKKYGETAEKYGRDYHRKLLNDYTAKTTHKRTITNHIKNLQAVCDYLESGDVYERVNSDYLYLSDEFKSLL